MKTWTIYIITACLAISLINACGDSSEEDAQRTAIMEQAERDSLERVYQAQLEQARLDSIAQAEADSIAKEEERQRIEYAENGDFVVQVEAWRSQSKAQRQASQWKEKGFDRAYVVEYGDRSTGDVWYRVRLGRFDSPQMAQKLKENLEFDFDARSWISRTDDPIEAEAMQGD